MKKIDWEPWMIELVKDQYGKMPPDELCKKLGVNRNGLVNYCTRHKIKAQRFMTEEQKQYIFDNYKTKTYAQIAKEIGVYHGTVSKFARKNGLKNKKFWTDDEVAYIERFVGEKTNKTMANYVNRSTHAVYSKLRTTNIGGFNENITDLRYCDVIELIGSSYKKLYTLNKKGLLKVKTLGKYRVVKETDLIKFMRNNPDKWDATECDYHFFARFAWFQEKYKEDVQKKIDERWGAV